MNVVVETNQVGDRLEVVCVLSLGPLANPSVLPSLLPLLAPFLRTLSSQKIGGCVMESMPPNQVGLRHLIGQTFGSFDSRDD